MDSSRICIHRKIVFQNKKEDIGKEFVYSVVQARFAQEASTLVNSPTPEGKILGWNRQSQHAFRTGDDFVDTPGSEQPTGIKAVEAKRLAIIIGNGEDSICLYC